MRLGIDTGGTCTDAVVLDGEREVVAAAKAETTHHDLSLGIGEAVRAVLGQGDFQIDLVGLSTTLATNAIVEGRGARSGLLLAGFGRDLLGRAGLGRVLASDPVAFIEGGHDAYGVERCPLDEAAARVALEAMAEKVDGIAITTRFSVRNPAHELRLADLAQGLTGLPCTLGSELSARLDAPRRAVTTLLNARLVPAITRLLRACEELLAELGITAPLMVVRGDGSLMRADTVRLRPVETILSGPAASVVGAATLSNVQDALVADVGGTTSDIALLTGGFPSLEPDGAVVGGHRTMVEAIKVRTTGLGGDSALGRDDQGGLTLGPRRHVPLSLLASRHPEILGDLEVQAARVMPRDHDARFALLGSPLSGKAGRSRLKLLELLADGPKPLELIVDREHLGLTLEALVERGHVLISGFTPTDAAHVLDRQSTWSVPAAVLGADLEARKGGPGSASIGRDADRGCIFAKRVIRLARQLTAKALVEVASGEGRPDWLNAPAVGEALDSEASRDGLLRVELRLSRPVVAVGGPAPLFYPEAVSRLGSELLLPPNHGVCNAVGAVVGEVRRQAEVTILQVDEHRYAVQHGEQRLESEDFEQLLVHAEAWVRLAAIEAFRAAGGKDAEIALERHDKRARLDSGREMVVEIRLSATARGRPALALM